MIRIEALSKSFGSTPVLQNINLSFERGKTSLIIGGSGSGKTVLMKCLVGLLEADTGSIYYDSVDFCKLGFAQRSEIRRKLGMLFQGGALFDSLTVLENVMFPLDMFTRTSKAEKKDRAMFCLERVNLVHAAALYPAELSGGMKKRVAIARAISNKPGYLFCDEPNSGLDPRTAILIDQLISEITHEFHITTVINTHDMNSVMEIGDKVCFLYQGSIWWEGTRHEILFSENPQLNHFVYATELMRELLRRNSSEPPRI